ncbi:hypothetical protein [Nocardioides antri]|uniref:Calx-beta domain-containing protein n=1 Tax=Nocardioides antri TaxID=2607659 RepID=A0A5B1M421_9ACTN|nr:hypothetical protein [Nocardioides antri]KAA1426879.1 hypothetical protein F0U47_11880 [Nocardioides antri]
MVKRLLLALVLGVAALPLAVGPVHATGPGLSIDDVTVVEPSWPDAEAPAVFTVTLDQPVATTVTVDYSASAPAIRATSGTLTFVPGDVSEQLAVEVLRRSSTANDESFVVTLSNTSGAPMADPWGVGRVLNSDRGGSWSCQTHPVEVWNYASVPTDFGPTAEEDVSIGSEHGCPSTDTSDPTTATNRVPGPLGTHGYTVEVGATRSRASTVPWPNPDDTRPFVGDGADVEASVATLHITGPGLDLRLDGAWATAGARCVVIGDPPSFTSASRVSGLVLNGRRIGAVTDERRIPVAGGVLWLNRTEPAGWPYRRQSAVHLVLNGSYDNHEVLVASASVYAPFGNPCST